MYFIMDNFLGSAVNSFFFLFLNVQIFISQLTFAKCLVDYKFGLIVLTFGSSQDT